MMVLLVLLLWLAISCLGCVLFSAFVRGAGRASECVEFEQFRSAEVPAPRASTEQRQPSRI